MSLLFSKNTPRENIEIFFESISKLKKSVNIIVRLHPRADKSIVESVAKKYNFNFKFSDYKEALITLLGRTDIVVGQDTSAILDAMITHKPVIYLPSMRWPATFVGGSGAVLEAHNSETLIKYLNVTIKNGITKKMFLAQKVFVEEYCNFSQNSVTKISVLINQLVKNTI
jgi:CDP-glycerol glycerophosphotransferase (TagB/SpsB family)